MSTLLEVLGLVLLILLVVFLFDNLSTALRQRLIGAPGSDRR